MHTADPAVVKPLHLRLLRLVARTNAVYGVPGLRLEGGTALAAYHLGHRESEDLDLFGDPTMNAREFGHAVRENAEREDLVLEPTGPASLGFARFVARDLAAGKDGAVRLDLAATSAFRLAPIEPTKEGVPIASFRDLSAGKLHALCDRFAERDFVDLHFILHRGDNAEPADVTLLLERFAALVRDLRMTDPGLNPSLVGQALSRGLDRPIVGELPLRLLAPVTDAAVQSTLRLCIEHCARHTREDLKPHD